MTKRQSQHRISIVDPAALSSVLDELVAEYGSQSKAARAIGLRQGHFSKLQNGKLSSITVNTYHTLLRHLAEYAHGGRRGSPETSEFGRSRRHVAFTVVDPPRDRGPLDEQSAKELEQLQQDLHAKREVLNEASRAYRTAEMRLALYQRPSPGEVAKTAGERARDDRRAEYAKRVANAAELVEKLGRALWTEDQDFAWGHYESWVTQQVRRLEAQTRPILERLWEHGEYGRLLRDFLERVGRDNSRLPDTEDRRCWLALLRAVAPLGDAESTWGVERGVKEMDQLDELGPYLTAALAAEDLLLRPRRDSERVGRARPPLSFAEWLGREALRDGDPVAGAEWLELPPDGPTEGEDDEPS